MGTFFLLLIIFFIIIPSIKGMIAIYRARRAARNYFDQFRRRAEESRQHSQPRPKKSRKKINPDDGEFVSFEEIPGKDDNADKTRAKVTVEQQIVDVEWEDLP